MTYVTAGMASGFFVTHSLPPSSHHPPERRSYHPVSSTMEQPQLAMPAHDARMTQHPYSGSHRDAYTASMGIFQPPPQHHHHPHHLPQPQHHHPPHSNVMSPPGGRKRRVSDVVEGPSLPPPSMSSSSSSVFMDSRYGASAPLSASPSLASMPKAKKTRTNTPWTPEEEQRLRECRDKGESWSEIARVCALAGLRSANALSADSGLTNRSSRTGPREVSRSIGTR